MCLTNEAPVTTRRLGPTDGTALNTEDHVIQLHLKLAVSHRSHDCEVLPAEESEIIWASQTNILANEVKGDKNF